MIELAESVSENITKKSIFKQAIYRNLYVFKAIGMETVYSSVIHEQARIHKENELIKDGILYTCDLELPVLNIGEKFYITELNKQLIIKDRVRASDNSYIYICEGEYVDDEKSLYTKRIAEAQKTLYFNNKNAEKELEKIKNHWLLGRLIKCIKFN